MATTLLLLYGPPAAGKLTVAREVALLTGFRVLHNHLTIDLAREIFPARDANYGDLVSRLRLDLFEAAARAGISLVSTFVYEAGADDDAFLDRIIEIVARHGGRTFCAQLLPSREALRARVEEPSRRRYAKIQEWSVLEGILDAHDLSTPIPGSLTLENSALPPEETARRIIDRWGLTA